MEQEQRPGPEDRHAVSAALSLPPGPAQTHGPPLVPSPRAGGPGGVPDPYTAALILVRGGRTRSSSTGLLPRRCSVIRDFARRHLLQETRGP